MSDPDRYPDVPPEAWAGVHRGPLRVGEWVRLVDQKGRKHNFELVAGKRFFFVIPLRHLGVPAQVPVPAVC